MLIVKKEKFYYFKKQITQFVLNFSLSHPLSTTFYGSNKISLSCKRTT